jgi:hypothetical protein
LSVAAIACTRPRSAATSVGEDTNTRTTRTLASIFIALFPRAETIAEAVQRPTMKFVATKTAEQLDFAPYRGAADQRHELAPLIRPPYHIVEQTLSCASQQI